VSPEKTIALMACLVVITAACATTLTYWHIRRYPEAKAHLRAAWNEVVAPTAILLLFLTALGLGSHWIGPS
jgi:hypothetical protein